MPKIKKSLCCPGTSGAKPAALHVLAKALAHPVRIQILEILSSRGTCICGDLVDELPVAQATVSQHLKVMKSAGLIRGVISGPKTCYCVDSEGLRRFKTLVRKL